MATRGKYHDQDLLTESSTNGPDTPLSCETAKNERYNIGPTYLVDNKSARQPGSTSQSNPMPLSPLPKPSSPSPQTSMQVRQTVLALIRDLVLNEESPDLLDSCANACKTYHLDLSALLQESFIERRSAFYWVIVRGRDALLQTLFAYAAPLSRSVISEIRLACLVTGNQHLFQSLRCKSGKPELAPLSVCCGADALVLGSRPPDEVSVREVGGQGAFVAEIRITLWQKRIRVTGLVNVEFIARGRMWSLTFFSPPASQVVGQWQVRLQLLEHSAPTFINSTLVIEPPPSNPLTPTTNDHVSRAVDLISFPSLPDDSNRLALCSPPSAEHTLGSTSKTPRTIELCLSSSHRLAYRHANVVKQWSDNGSTYTNGIVVSLDDGGAVELAYDNNPFTSVDGTLYARFEARLEQR